MKGLALSILATAVAGVVVSPSGPMPVTREVQCDFALDVAQLIDVSWSQLDNAAALKKDTGVVLDFIAKSNGRHRLALATFIDKPVAPLGWNTAEWKDYCFKLAADFGLDGASYKAAVDKLYLAGGYDFPEAQLEAMLRGALNPDFKWRDQTEDGLPVQKVVLVATDSIAHAAGDAHAIDPQIGTNYLTANVIAAEGLDARCGAIDYPSQQILAQALKAKGILPIFLAAPTTFDCDTGRCVFPEMVKLAKETGNDEYADPVKGIQLYYTELMKKLGVTGVVVPMGEGFEGYGEALKTAVYEAGHIICDTTTTTTTTEPLTVASEATEATTTTSTTTPPTTTTDECDIDDCTNVIHVKFANNCNGNVITDTFVV